MDKEPEDLHHLNNQAPSFRLSVSMNYRVITLLALILLYIMR